MTFENTLSAFLPVYILVGGIVLLLLSDVFVKKRGVSFGLTVVTLFSAILGVYAYDGALPGDGNFFFGIFYRNFATLTLFASIFVAFLIYHDFSDDMLSWDLGVVYTLMLLANAGGLLVASATNLIPLYIGFELMAIPNYGMVAYKSKERNASEAAMKIFILGALATSLTVFGLSLLYGATGSLQFNTVVASIVSDVTALKLLASFMLVAGVSFKLGLVPFHWWISDVYAGAPVSIVSFMAATTKVIGFTFAFQLFLKAIPNWSEQWVFAFTVLTILTMIIGNALGVLQRRVMRIMAYSSIAQAGYIAVTFVNYALVSDSNDKSFALAAGFIQLIAVVLLKISALSVVLIVVKSYGSDDLSNFRGLFTSNPIVGLSFMFALMGLMGVPLLGGLGFLGKFLIVLAAIEANTAISWTLAIVLITGSVISIFYYMRIINEVMVKEDAPEKPLKTSVLVNFVLIVLTLTNLGLMFMGEVIPFYKLF